MPAPRRWWAAALPFTWGGCDGVVPFSALTDCQGACEPWDAFSAATTPAPTHAATEISIRNDSAQAIYLRAYTPASDAVGFRPTDPIPLTTTRTFPGGSVELVFS